MLQRVSVCAVNEWYDRKKEKIEELDLRDKASYPDGDDDDDDDTSTPIDKS